MRHVSNRYALLIVSVLLPAAFAEHKVGPAPEDKTGIKIGEKAPAFKLKDQNGQERSLEDFLKTGKVALVFTRSADW